MCDYRDVGNMAESETYSPSTMRARVVVLVWSQTDSCKRTPKMDQNLDQRINFFVVDQKMDNIFLIHPQTPKSLLVGLMLVESMTGNEANE